MARCSSVWRLWKYWAVVSVGSVVSWAFLTAARRSGSILSLWRWYLLRESCLLVCFCCLGVLLWNMVYIARWSASGGDIVPAVAAVWFSVVSTTSMSVLVLWCGSHRVGVVIVVFISFSVRKFMMLLLGDSRLKFMSPMIVIDVVGDFVYIWSIADWRFFMKSGSEWGLLYMPMIVWMGFVFCLLAWIWMMFVATFGTVISFICVVLRFWFVYIVTSVMWCVVYPVIGSMF